MKHAKELAYLRQLCCLGLPKESFLPEFLRAISTVIPSHNNTYSGVDPSEFKPADFCLPYDDAELISTTQQTLKSYWIPERSQRCAAWIQKNRVLTDYTVLDEDYYDSDAFQLALKPLGQYHPLLVFIPNHGKLIGAITLFRPRSQKPFDNYDQTLLLRLMPYVSHAFQSQKSQDLQYVDKGVTALLLMDTAGNILYQSAVAERLLLFASYPLVPMNATQKNNHLQPQLTKLCRNLNTLFEGRAAPPPAFCHTNGRGRFIFTAHWLDKANRDPGGLIGVTIEHQEPLNLKILRALRDSPLSPVQMEVALLLAQGVNSEKIGERLHIKYSTVKDHVRKIFDKLDIHRREELLPRLLEKEKIDKKWQAGYG